jgi:PAS domain S-box-containing protein
MDDFGGHIKEAFRAGRTLAIADVAADDRITAAELAAYHALGFRAFVGIPLLKEGRFVAGLGIHSATPREWSQIEVAIAEATADRTWAALERARAGTASREAAERLQETLTAARMANWRWEPETGRIATSANMEELLGLPEGVSFSNSAQSFEIVHPEDRPAHQAMVETAGHRGEGWHGQFRIIRPRDGQVAWLEERASPARDPVTGKTHILGLVWEVTERHRMEERQAMLLHELQHRVRNILAVVRSLARRTTQTAGSVEEVGQLLDGRIDALARTQAVLARAVGAGVDLEMLVSEELLAQAPGMAGIEIGGPQVTLSSKAAEVLTLAIHELATNATRYGAIGQGGSIQVAWGVARPGEGPDWLHLIWTERGVKVIAAGPRREGLGTEAIERRVAYELKGRGRMELRPGGITAEISFPLLAGESILETDPSIFGDDDGMAT